MQIFRLQRYRLDFFFFPLGTSSFFLSFYSSRQPVFSLRLAHLPEASVLTLDGLLGRDGIRNGSQRRVHFSAHRMKT